MALIRCPECGKQISDKSTACPYCGLPSQHYAPDVAPRQRSSSLGLSDCSIIKPLLTKYPNLLSPIAEMHKYLTSLGFNLEEGIDRVNYYANGKLGLHVYPNRSGGSGITIQLICRGKSSTILLTPTANIEKTKQYIFETAQKEGLLTSFALQEEDFKDFNAKELKNMLISYDRDYFALLSRQRYIDTTTATEFKNRYQKYYTLLENELVLQYVRTNAIALQIDDIGLGCPTKRRVPA